MAKKVDTNMIALGVIVVIMILLFVWSWNRTHSGKSMGMYESIGDELQSMAESVGRMAGKGGQGLAHVGQQLQGLAGRVRARLQGAAPASGDSDGAVSAEMQGVAHKLQALKQYVAQDDDLSEEIEAMSMCLQDMAKDMGKGDEKVSKESYHYFRQPWRRRRWRRWNNYYPYYNYRPYWWW